MKTQHWMFGVLRLFLGWIFLWPFFDKVFGLGFATTAEKAWRMGVSPTAGFLGGAKGPFADLFHAMQGSPIVDWLFMLGLLLIGLSLIFGIGVRVAVWSGSVLLFLMWLAVLPPKQNPVLDEHLVYIVLLQVLRVTESGQYLGFGKWWAKRQLVRKYRWLQ